MGFLAGFPPDVTLSTPATFSMRVFSVSTFDIVFSASDGSFAPSPFFGLLLVEDPPVWDLVETHFSQSISSSGLFPPVFGAKAGPWILSLWLKMENICISNNVLEEARELIAS